MKEVLAFLFLTATLFSCRQDPLPPTQQSNQRYLIPAAVKDYCHFQTGSYWIYQDSATGALDSVYVYYAAQGFDTLHDQSYNGLYEWFECKMMSSLDNYTYEHWWHATWNTSNPLTSGCFRNKYRPSDNAGETFIFDYPITVGHYRYWGGNEIVTSGNYSVLLVNSVAWNNVVEISETNDPTMNNSHSRYFLVKNFGIVRRINLDSSAVWNLVNYQIVQ